MPETEPLPSPSEPLSLKAFESQQGSTFTLPFDDGLVVNLTLETIETKSAERFTLCFHGPPEHPLRQATYLMDHEVLGRLGIFLVPIAQDANGFQYEAVFNLSPIPPAAN